MRKKFRDLKILDKVYVEHRAYFVQSIEIKDGYMKLILHPNIKGAGPCMWKGYEYFIPMNHLSADKVKVKGLWIFLGERAYKKHMYNFIKSQIEK